MLWTDLPLPSQSSSPFILPELIMRCQKKLLQESVRLKSTFSIALRTGEEETFLPKWQAYIVANPSDGKRYRGVAAEVWKPLLLGEQSFKCRSQLLPANFNPSQWSPVEAPGTPQIVQHCEQHVVVGGSTITLWAQNPIAHYVSWLGWAHRLKWLGHRGDTHIPRQYRVFSTAKVIPPSEIPKTPGVQVRENTNVHVK